MQIRKAARTHRRLKLALGGVSGSGKTIGALKLASGLAPWHKICIIDTEQNSADLYADLGAFSVLPLDKYAPGDYIRAVDLVIAGGFDVMIVDSITHEWSGTGGVLEFVDKISQTSRSGNTFAAWGQATPLHNQFIQKLTTAPLHVITTMRKKDDYVISVNDKGRSTPQKVGLKNIQRDGTDYEFDVVFDIHINHLCTVSKDRTRLFDARQPFELTDDVGAEIMAWAETGEAAPPPPAQDGDIVIYTGEPDQQKRIAAYAEKSGVHADFLAEIHDAMLDKPMIVGGKVSPDVVAAVAAAVEKSKVVKA